MITITYKNQSENKCRPLYLLDDQCLGRMQATGEAEIHLVLRFLMHGITIHHARLLQIFVMPS